MRRFEEDREELVGKCSPAIESVTVQIVGIRDRKVVHDRTGVLCQIGESHFVLTAAHGLRELSKNRIRLFISSNAANAEPVELEGAVFNLTEEDDRDVAAILLPEHAVQEIGKTKRFLRHNQISFGPIRRDTPYVIFGYPMEWADNVVANAQSLSTGMVFYTFEHEGDLHPNPDQRFRAEVHFALEYSRDDIMANAECERLPRPHGISGCGVWQVADVTTGGWKIRTAETLTLVGIQHTWFPEQGYVQATRIGFLLDAISKQYPKTRGPMKLIYKSAS